MIWEMEGGVVWGSGYFVLDIWEEQNVNLNHTANTVWRLLFTIKQNQDKQAQKIWRPVGQKYLGMLKQEIDIQTVSV